MLKSGHSAQFYNYAIFELGLDLTVWYLIWYMYV